jgi:hypothetical protein
MMNIRPECCALHELIFFIYWVMLIIWKCIYWRIIWYFHFINHSQFQASIWQWLTFVCYQDIRKVGYDNRTGPRQVPRSQMTIYPQGVGQHCNKWMITYHYHNHCLLLWYHIFFFIFVCKFRYTINHVSFYSCKSTLYVYWKQYSCKSNSISAQ